MVEGPEYIEVTVLDSYTILGSWHQLSVKNILGDDTNHSSYSRFYADTSLWFNFIFYRS